MNIFAWPARRTLAHVSLTALLLFSSSSAHADDSPHKYMGIGSCSSSNCHGNVNPVASGNVLQNEYVTWQKHDKHAHAYTVLGNEQSQTIAKHLGIKSAQSEPLCLKCHSTYVPNAADRGDKFQIEDGVGCETCHGPASAWLSTHTSREATHQQNVEKGLNDLVGLSRRSQLCLSCHHGNEDKAVDHRLIAAGHPRLSFELDTFESIMPRHWEIDKDYRDRKMDYHSTGAWLNAQVSQAEQELAQISSKKRSMMGTFPEFTMFNCYACHHNLSEEQYKSRDYTGHLGEPTLNLPALVMLEQVLGVLNPKSSATLGTLRADLQKDFHEGANGKAIQSLQKIVRDPVLGQHVGDQQRKQILKRLIAYAANTPHLQYETAEQLAMGISSLVAESEHDSATLKSGIDGIYDALKNEKTFVADGFTAAAKKLSSQASAL